MPSIGGYTASVLIEGTPAPEYCVTITTDHTTGQPRATAYIESKSEQDFSVKFEGTNPTSGMHSITAKLTVDAERVVAINAQQPNISLHFLGKPAPGGYKAMAFRVPKLVSDDDVGGAELLAVQREKGVDAGAIRVEVWREIVTSAPYHYPMTADASSSNELKIHEKAKKATLISHATGFGKLLPSNAPETRIHTQKLDPWPIATFIFLYRSRALLSVMEGVDLPPEIEPALTQTSGSSQAASSSTPSEPSRKSTGNGGPSTSSKRGRDATPGSASDNISARLPVVVDVDALPDTPNLKRVKMEVKVEGGTSRPAAGYVVDLTGDD